MQDSKDQSGKAREFRGNFQAIERRREQAGKNMLNVSYQTVSGYIMAPLSLWLRLEMSY